MRKERAENRAIKCPECGEANLKVTDSRPVEGSICRRRRRCKSCDYRFTTYEVIEEKLFYQGDGAFVLNRASEIQGLLKHLAYIQSRLESLLGEKEEHTDDEPIPTPQTNDGNP